jgi:hypothetical protein
MQFALASAALAPLVQNIKWQPACQPLLMKEAAGGRERISANCLASCCQINNLTAQLATIQLQQAAGQGQAAPARAGALPPPAAAGQPPAEASAGGSSYVQASRLQLLSSAMHPLRGHIVTGAAELPCDAHHSNDLQGGCWAGVEQAGRQAAGGWVGRQAGPP